MSDNAIKEIVNLKTIKKEMRKQRFCTYAAGVFVVAAFIDAMWLFFESNVLIVLALLLFYLSLGIFFIYRIIKCEKRISNQKYDEEAYEYLRKYSDKYTKRLYNSIALLISAIFVFIGSELSFYFFGNSKSAELIENFFSNMVLIEVPLYLLVKNTIMHKVIMHRIDLPIRKKSRIYVIGFSAFTTIYWLVITLVTALNRDKINYPANVYIIAGIVFSIILLIINFTIRKKVTYKNIVFNGMRVSVVTLAVVIGVGFVFLNRDTWYTQRLINSVPVVDHNASKIDYNDETGVYTITKSTDDFKILHLTDIHIGGSLYSYAKDVKALNACYEEIEHTHPDFVIVTGDMCFPLGIMSLSFNNAAPVQQFAAFMRNTGIPWAFTYGNHDTESTSSLDDTELPEVYKSLSYKTSRTLLYPYVQPEISGRNNQVIELRNSDGSFNTALFLIDSNSYTGEGVNTYDYIHDDQVDWYEDEVRRLSSEEGHTINSLVFFHIPLQEYLTATELYNQGSDEVKYFFGENPGDHGGITNKLVGCSDFPSRMFDKAVELGSTTGMFCGHDHYNNASLEYKGIRLTYGMSIDYLAMPGISKETKQRGAELITIHSDGSWDLEQIPLDTIEI